MITCHRKYLEARCNERGRSLADAMPCVVKQDGDQWTIDVDHPAYPRADVSNDTIEARRAACSKCQYLKRTDYGQPYCRKHREHDGRICERWAVGQYTLALLDLKPWCKFWKAT